MHQPPYHLHLPECRSSSLIFASPHSGSDYAPEFLERAVLGPLAMRSSEDAFVDQLVGTAPKYGVPLLAARVPRAYVDLNRGRDELDPALIEGVRIPLPNLRVASGLGVIPRVVSNGRAIYRGKLPLSEAERRLRQVWDPYHACLRGLIDDHLARFGEAVVIDWHSMPHDAIQGAARGAGKCPDVVLGDRHGASASGEVVARVEAALGAAGLRVARNAPFAGVFVAEHYGRPLRGVHVVQIEIDRALYMDERNVHPRADFTQFQQLMNGVIAAIAGQEQAGEQTLAAE
ncbi:N-formylglutamate amidohydrolase [Alkalilacustris brevis]|uniref:N-formylglutamate amidohydrolase n=1 Tax=Alkalilacustris brevis TaxID=2026338 RepID=UPI000E0DBC91|nr:N-formylglutamate amidohydrolase [Alkalilacustris brevis]